MRLVIKPLRHSLRWVSEAVARLSLIVLFLYLETRRPFQRVIHKEELWLYQNPMTGSYVPTTGSTTALTHSTFKSQTAVHFNLSFVVDYCSSFAAFTNPIQPVESQKIRAWTAPAKSRPRGLYFGLNITSASQWHRDRLDQAFGRSATAGLCLQMLAKNRFPSVRI